MSSIGVAAKAKWDSDKSSFLYPPSLFDPSRQLLTSYSGGLSSPCEATGLLSSLFEGRLSTLLSLVSRSHDHVVYVTFSADLQAVIQASYAVSPVQSALADHWN